jgi:hypothetical protein
VPLLIKQNDWVATVKKAMVGIDSRTKKVPAAADTTESAMLGETFLRFLTHKQIQRGSQPYMVKSAGQVYRADGFYYFDTRGLVDYLNMEKRVLGRTNLSKWLQEKQGCIPDAELPYKTVKGEEKIIRCWKKAETPELLALDVFYEDVYENDADIIRKNPLKKKEEKEKEKDDVDDTKF